MAIRNGSNQVRPDLIDEISMLHNRIVYMGVYVTLVWVPAHCGIRGNEIADRAARDSSSKRELLVALPYSLTEINSVLTQDAYNQWQVKWLNSPTGQFFRQLHPKVSRFAVEPVRNRRDDVIITRLKTGHVRLNAHLFRICCHCDGLCDVCHVPESVSHYIMDCVNLLDYHWPIVQYLYELKLPISLHSILGDRRIYPLLIEFVRKSGRYSQL